MIGIIVSNPAQFAAQAAAALARLELHVTKVFRGFAVTAFQRVVNDTPQWTGNAAASWNFSIGEPDFSTDNTMISNPKKREDAFRVQDQPAVQRAYDRNKGNEKSVTLGASVFLSNSAESLKGKKYIQMLEDNPQEYLRDENEGGGMLAKTVDSMNSDYDAILPSMAQNLKLAKVG